MSTFCTNSSKLKFSSTNSLKSLLTACDNKIIDSSKDETNSFNGVFGQDGNNQLLSRACGIPPPNNIYNSRPAGPSNTLYPLNNNIPDVPDQNTFYAFWSVPNQIQTLSKEFRNLFAGTGNNEPHKFFSNLNPLIGSLFYYLVCTASPNNGNIPLLNKNDPSATVLDNWKFFLANIRGISSINTCKYCVDDYLLPIVKNKPSNAGGIVRNSLSNNPFLRGWCGCCIPQYDKFSRGDIDYDFSNPFINKTNLKDYPLYCEPVCNNPDGTNDPSNKSIIIPLIEGKSDLVNAVIPNPTKADSITYDAPTCSNTVCIISEIAVDTVATKGGGINFSQVCPGCASAGQEGKCTCYSYGKDTFDKMSSGNSGMQDPATFKQECPNSFCFEEQADGKYKEVKCNSVNPGNTGKDPINTYNGNGVFNDLSEANVFGVDTWLFPISLLVMLIILFLGAIFVTVYRNRVMPRMRQEN